MSSNWIIIGAFFLLAAIARLYVINSDSDDPDRADKGARSKDASAPNTSAESASPGN